MGDRLVAEADRVAVVEVADMLRDERFATARQRDRVLEIGAGGEHARPFGAEVDRLGDEAARAADEGRRAVEDRASPNRRRARRSGASWPTTRSAIGAEAAARLVVVGDQRFAAEIGAGGDEREIVGAHGASAAKSGSPASACRTSHCSGV